MSLSERERKVLEELERGLYADDAELANRFRKAANQTPLRKQQRKAGRLIAGALVVLGGLMVVLTGAILQVALIGVAGFAMTLVGLVIATGYWSGSAQAKSVGSKRGLSGESGTKPKHTISDFFEERWDNRDSGS